MNSKTHTKKPFTTKANRFFKRVFPNTYFVRLNNCFGLDNKKQKIFFRSFAFFIIAVVILQPQDTSLRDLSATSKESGIQRLTGIQGVSHTAIGKRINSIPTESMDELLGHLSQEYKGRLRYKNPFPKGMKVFDVTTFSVSSKHYEWAATRQTRGNIRFLFIMDSYSGTPDAIVDASTNLNDNKVFQTALSSAKHGKYFVFDKGFNNFRVLKRLSESKQYFITRFKENYVFNPRFLRKIPSSNKLEKGWVLESDEVGILGQKTNPNQFEIRKITCREISSGKTFLLMTDDRNLSAKKIVKMYVYRWPIEVLFRHIKSNLKLIHFPSRDPIGVRNWILFIALSIICIQLIAIESGISDPSSLMLRGTQFKAIIRIARARLRDWIIELSIIAIL